MSEARDLLDAKATDALYTARDAGQMMDGAAAAVVSELLQHPEQLRTLLAEVEAPETFLAIRRTDGERIFDEWGWCGADGSDPWETARDDAPRPEDYDADDPLEPVEYELVEMTVRSIEKRAFPEPAVAAVP